MQLVGVPPGMERRAWARVVAAWKRLPDLFARVRALERAAGLDGPAGRASDRGEPALRAGAGDDETP
jgi:hypothetical protein